MNLVSEARGGGEYQKLPVGASDRHIDECSVPLIAKRMVRCQDQWDEGNVRCLKIWQKWLYTSLWTDLKPDSERADGAEIQSIDWPQKAVTRNGLKQCWG